MSHFAVYLKLTQLCKSPILQKKSHRENIHNNASDKGHVSAIYRFYTKQ